MCIKFINIGARLQLDALPTVFELTYINSVILLFRYYIHSVVLLFRYLILFVSKTFL